MKSLTKYVIFSIAILVIYALFEFIYGIKSGIQHDTLTTCVFSAFGGELLSCCILKIFKIRKE